MMTRTGNYFSVQGDRPRKGQSKAARIENLEPRFANGQIYIKHEHKGLESDLLEYQGIDKSKYVDTLDALAGAINISRFPFREADEPTMKTGVTLESILEELRGKFHKTFPIYGRHN
jgi:hypothetical protein